MKRFVRRGRVIGAAELITAAGALMLLAAVAAFAPERWVRFLEGCLLLFWIGVARRWRHEAEGWESQARWEAFWRHHEVVIPEPGQRGAPPPAGDDTV